MSALTRHAVHLTMALCVVWAPRAGSADSVRTGIYGLTAAADFEAAARLVARSGFDVAVVPPARERLDVLRRHGLRGLAALWVRREVVEAEKWGAFLEDVRAKVVALKDDPTVFAWYVADEPDGQRIDRSRIEEVCALVRSLDSDTPLMAVFDDPARWAQYLPLFDIVAVDPYLRALPDGSFETPAVVTRWLQKLRVDVAALESHPQVWVVLGAFEGRPRSVGAPPRYRKPTTAEFEDMVRQALASGVEGILVYSYAFPESRNMRAWNLPADDPLLWRTVQAMAEKP